MEKNFKHILVPELNMGQMVNILNAKFGCNAIGYNKVMGLPFKISELVEAVNGVIDGKPVKNPGDWKE